MIKFDLSGTPPSADDIDAERRAQTEALRKIADRERLRKRTSVVGILAVALVAIFAADVPAPLILGVCVTVAAVAAATTFGFEPWIGVPRAAALSALSDLAPVDRAHCPAILAWCQSDPVLARYQAAVAGQGRMLTGGEYRAMRDRVSTAQARIVETRREAEETAAYEALMKPVSEC